MRVLLAQQAHHRACDFSVANAQAQDLARTPLQQLRGNAQAVGFMNNAVFLKVSEGL